MYGLLENKTKQEELINRVSNYKIDILGKVDNKIIHDDPIEYHEKHNSTLITTSATRNVNNTPIDGIGLLLNRTSSESLAEIKPYNSHILVVHFNGNSAAAIIVHYAPVEGDEDAIDQYEQLSGITRTIPKHHVSLLIADCNAHFGPEDALYTLYDKTDKMENYFSIILQKPILSLLTLDTTKNEKTMTFDLYVRNE